jgi:hypothetical protein
MRAKDRADLIAMIRQHPGAEVVLPEELYSAEHNGIRTQIGGIKVMLHRWLYDQLNPDNPLGDDKLRRDDKHNPRNVNPLLMQRVSPSDRLPGERCRKGHLYSEVGELPRGRGDGRRCRKCWQDSRNRTNAANRDEHPGVNPATANRDKTHCKYGHEFTPENTIQWPGDRGRRRCRTCQTIRAKARWQERKNHGSTQAQG